MQAFLLVAGEFLKKYWLYIVAFIGGLLLWNKLFGRGVGADDKPFGVPTYPTTGATITKEDARAFSIRMYNAMAVVGTDVDELDRIYSVLSTNAYNFRSVYNEFGVREYGFFGAFSLPFGVFSDHLDLIGWLKKELSPSDYNKWLLLKELAQIR